MQVVGWIATIAVVGAIVAGVVIGVKSAPDVRRYLKMRNM